MNPMLEADCTSRCRSTRCATNLNAVVTRGTVYQIKTYFARCRNASHVVDKFGRTALHMAASCSKFEIVNWLVREKHANLGAEDLESGWTALHRSIFHGQVIAAVYLISHGASLDKHDNEDLTPLELAMKDHPVYAEYDPRGPSQVYSWGSNANFNLGHGGGKSRSQPDLVDQFVRDGLGIKQVVMCKFHTIYLTQQGTIFTCGHGQGGRLGHGNEEACLRPHPVTALADKTCEFVAAARDHTLFVMEDGSVYSCGLNSHHQLGHSTLGVMVPTPKLISSKQIKNKTILGAAAGRFHSVVHTKEAVYTFGLNAGQLGHVKGEKFVISPRHVTTLHRDKVELTHVTTSDAATVCATKAGDIYVLNEYQCRKVASKQLNLLKIVAIGGSLDSDLGDAALQKEGGTELMILVLHQSGWVYSWRSTSRTLRRCLWTRKRQVFMSDMALSRQGVMFCTKDGEAFTGRILRRKASSTSCTKDSTPHHAALRPSSPNTVGETLPFRDWHDDHDETERVSLNRLPVIHRAMAVACDPNGLNFAVIQADPKASLFEVPSISSSQMAKDLSQFLTEADTTDGIHDVVLKVGQKSIAAHKYILALRSDYFRRLFLQTPLCNTNSTSDTVGLSPVNDLIEIHNVSDKTDFHNMMLLLQYIYTDTCDLLRPDYDFKLSTGALQNLTSITDDLNNLMITEEDRHKSAYGVYKEHREKTGRLNAGKKNKKGEKGKRSESDAMGHVKRLIDVARKFGVKSLIKRLETAKFKDGRLQNFRPSSNHLQFNHRQLSQLCDVVLCSEEGTLFPCHKCILVARLDYFQSMLGSGWIEASSSDPLKMPLPAAVLSILLEYIYTDDTSTVRSSTDIELLCNTLTTADQLLIGRLKEICEVALVDLISLRNVAELLQFASIYRAEQLKATCHQYIGLNLACLLEARSLEILDDNVLLDLTKACKEMIPSMPYRIITPYQDGPDISYIEEEPSAEVTEVKGQDVIENENGRFDSGDFDQVIKRAKAKRKAGRRSSTGKRKSVSFSESGDCPVLASPLPDVIPRNIAREMNNLSLATKIGQGGIDLDDRSTCPSSMSLPSEPQQGDSVLDTGGIKRYGVKQSETTPSSHDKASSGLRIQPVVGINSKGALDSAVDERLVNYADSSPKMVSKEAAQTKAWHSPSMPDVTGPDLRTIMMSEESRSAMPRKSLSSSRITTPIGKKSQKQRKREQERAADGSISPTSPSSPGELTASACPWGSASKAVTASSQPFLEVQMEEQRIMGNADVTMTTSTPQSQEKLSFGIVARTRRTSDNNLNMPSEAPPLEASPGEVPENPWLRRASSPPVPQVSFTEIMKTESEQRESLAKSLRKPFSLIQIEERAIEELKVYYRTEERTDEYITVERATSIVVTPLWRKGKDSS